MGNIQDLLAQILSARYGRDVRQSIHDAIETCYEDGHAGAIDLQARTDIAAETTAREALDTRVGGIDTRVEALENDTTTAAEVTYDDTTTQLGATDAQGAIEALNNNLTNVTRQVLYSSGTASVAVQINAGLKILTIQKVNVTDVDVMALLSNAGLQPNIVTNGSGLCQVGSNMYPCRIIISSSDIIVQKIDSGSITVVTDTATVFCSVPYF